MRNPLLRRPKKTKHKRKSFSSKVGLPPGSLLYTGDNTGESTIEVIEYSKTEHQKKMVDNPEALSKYKDSEKVSWININGLADLALMEKIKATFGLHRLLMEDILNVDHRPKIEEYDNCVFVTLKMLYQNPEDHTIESEQISLVLGEHYVISFQEKKGDLFEPIRERIEAGKGLARSKGADYLLYMLIDVIVDNYFNISEYLGEKIEHLEEEIFSEPDEEDVGEIQAIKKELIFLKRSIYPLRDMLNSITKTNIGLIQTPTQNYFRDVQDHAITLVESIETYREWNAELKDVYLSSLSNKMNQIMKVLTIISTIFIPMTFIAGIYGMNFQYMPELSWKYGYFGVWGLMLVIFITMVIYFKHRKWL